MNKNNQRYSIWRLLFIGKKPLDRKHKPKIIEYFWLGLNNFITLTLIALATAQFFYTSGDFNHKFSVIFDKFWNKVLLAAFIGNVFATICSSIRLFIIIKKTEEFKLLAKLTGVFSILILTAPIAIIFSILSYKYNEIEFI